MKKYISLLVVTAGFLSAISAQSVKIPIYSIKDNRIISGSGFINNGIIQKPIAQKPYTLKAMLTLESLDKKSTFDVKCYKINDRSESNLDFQLIRIVLNTKLLLEIQNDETWIKIPEYLRKYSDNEYYITTKIDKETSALFFVGKLLSNKTPTLTAIVSRNNDANVVLNKNFFIESINTINNDFELILREVLVDNSNIDAKKVKIWVSNGELYLGDIL